MSRMSSALVCRALVKRYGDLSALDRLDLAVAPGEVLAIVGFSGAGKTTPGPQQARPP